MLLEPISSVGIAVPLVAVTSESSSPPPRIHYPASNENTLTLEDFVLQVMDSNFFSAFFAVAGVVLGAWLTHKYTMESKVRQDNRDRLIAAVMEALECAEELLSNFSDYASHAPYGGGRYRDSDDPTGNWKKLPKAQARFHDAEAAAAIGRMLENSNKLRKLNVNLSVFAPVDLVESFQAIPNRVTKLFAALVDEGIHRGNLAHEALEDMEYLFNAALDRARELAEVKFKTNPEAKNKH